jgi:hypothetical protein
MDNLCASQHQPTRSWRGTGDCPEFGCHLACEDSSSLGAMSVMLKAFPIEFRRDVVAVARPHDAPISQGERDFGISEICLQRWFKLDDIDSGRRGHSG